MYCPKCGQEMADKTTFCGNCGQNLEKVEVTPSVVASAPALRKDWWRQWWGIILLVVLVGPLGAIGLYFTLKSNLSTPIKRILSVIIVIAALALSYSLTGSQ